MKRSTGLLVLLLILSAGAGAFAVLMTLDQHRQAARLELASQVLTGVYDKSQVLTSEGVFQFLFPFDFLPWDPIAWKELERQSSLGRPIPPNDWETLELVRLARKIGFDPKNDGYKFLVLGVQVKAGIDLAAEPLEVSWSSGPQGPLLVLSLPTPVVTDFLVLDLPEGTAYPPVNFSPQDWKMLVQRLKPRIIGRILQEGLLDQGRENARGIFGRILQTAGFDQYEIVWKKTTAPRSAQE